MRSYRMFTNKKLLPVKHLLWSRLQLFEIRGGKRKNLIRMFLRFLNIFQVFIHFDQTNLPLFRALPILSMTFHHCCEMDAVAIEIREFPFLKSDNGRVRVSLDHRIVFLPESELAIGTNNGRLGRPAE